MELGNVSYTALLPGMLRSYTHGHTFGGQLDMRINYGGEQHPEFKFKGGHEAFLGFPGDSVGKESTCNARDLGLIPGLGRSPGEGNGNPLQYSCLENSKDRGAWRASVHRAAESCTHLSD